MTHRALSQATVLRPHATRLDRLLARLRALETRLARWWESVVVPQAMGLLESETACKWVAWLITLWLTVVCVSQFVIWWQGRMGR